MPQVALKQATYADLEAVPPHRVAEILHGVLYSHPRPSPRHAIASASLGSALLEPFQKGRGGPGGWIFMVEPELHLNGDIVVPDIAGWRRERLSVLPETAFIETPPDWVCEILSPATERLDRNEKRAIYAAAGACLSLVGRSARPRAGSFSSRRSSVAADRNCRRRRRCRSRTIPDRALSAFIALAFGHAARQGRDAENLI